MNIASRLIRSSINYTTRQHEGRGENEYKRGRRNIRDIRSNSQEKEIEKEANEIEHRFSIVAFCQKEEEENKEITRRQR